MPVAPLPTKPCIHTGGNADPVHRTQFFIHRLVAGEGPTRAKSEYLHKDLKWRPMVFTDDKPTGYYATKGAATTTLRKWQAQRRKAA